MSFITKTFDNAIFDYVNSQCVLETLADDCLFTEGPVWTGSGYFFSDIEANVIYRLKPGEKKQVLIKNSGTSNPGDDLLKPDQVGSNGLAFDKQGNLLVCRHGSHMVATWNGETLQDFITKYNGKPFNSPNDIVVDEQGRIFFSDPPYGLKDAKLNPEKFQPSASVYCFKEGELKIICDKYQYPNGVCITPDQNFLYICSTKPFEKFISVYNLANLQFEKILAEENSDGIKCDVHGNVYLASPEGLLILNKEGERLALLELPSAPTNLCWGGAAGKDLFITARTHIFFIRNLLR